MNTIEKELRALQIAIPSWALGTGGTRFGRFAGGGEPGSLEEKIADVAFLKSLNPAVSGISLHIPWDIPRDPVAARQQLDAAGLKIESVNSNTFQDQPGQLYSYKFGSLSHTDQVVRQRAIEHNREVIDIGKALGAKSLTVWLADGSNFPGQQHLRRAFERTLESLREIYEALPSDWTLLLEYKPYEPNFYSMVIPDWGTSYSLCQQLGPKAQVLVDLGHHLPNTNIEQIVGRLLHLQRLGGFHFNGSMYGDDDLTTGAIKPYQLFLLFNELVDGAPAQKIDYMIDASHNVKDPLEDLLQSLEAIQIAYAQALLVDQPALHLAQENNDVALCQKLVQDAFRTDVRPLLAQANVENGGTADPFTAYRSSGYRERMIEERGTGRATGL